MARDPTLHQPRANLQAGKNDMEISAVPTVPTYLRDIEKEGVKYKKYGSIGHNRKKVGTVGTVGTPQIGPASVTVGEPDAIGRPHRVGEDHPKASLSDAQVEAIRDAYDAHPEGHPEHIGYRALGKQYGVSKRTIRDIVNFRRRNVWADREIVPRSRRRKKRDPNPG